MAEKWRGSRGSARGAAPLWAVGLALPRLRERPEALADFLLCRCAILIIEAGLFDRRVAGITAFELPVPATTSRRRRRRTRCSRRSPLRALNQPQNGYEDDRANDGGYD